MKLELKLYIQDRIREAFRRNYDDIEGMVEKGCGMFVTFSTDDSGMLLKYEIAPEIKCSNAGEYFHHSTFRVTQDILKSHTTDAMADIVIRNFHKLDRRSWGY